MAASSKPTALHVSLIISVMVTIILGVLTWMSHRDYNEAVAREVALQGELTTSKNAHQNRIEDITFLKGIIGHQQEQVGREEPENPATVGGQMKADLATLGGDLAQPTYHETLVKFRTELNSTVQQRNDVNQQLEEAKRTILQLQGQYQGTVDVHQQAAAEAAANLQAQIKEKQDLAEAKQREYDKLSDDHSKTLVDLDSLQTKYKTDVSKLQADMSQLEKINSEIRDKLEQVTKESYEVADGLIRSVDHNTGLVWINLGEADKLQKRTTFSVYNQNHHGIGRGPEDIKGSIEVTNITGPHIAEARILNSDLYRPIAPNDPIYSPVWSPNQVETFSFVGLIDLDGDGQSDRDRLHEIIAAAGAKIDNEVDDQGNRTGDGINVNTKFLVRGDVPDPAKAPPHQRAVLKKMHEEDAKIREEARLQGVRQVNLNAFLDYMGYRTTQRFWVPGGKMPWTLRSGAKKTGQDTTVPLRGLGGRSSGIFESPGRRANQPVRRPDSTHSSEGTQPAATPNNYNAP